MTMTEHVNETRIVTPNGVEACARAEIDMQISTAKRYPRDLATVKASMIGAATLDQETAALCFYSLPRGGKDIKGPSVRLAEIAVSCYKNLRAGTRIVAIEAGENPHVVVQAVCHDLEANTAVTIEKRRIIQAKKIYKNKEVVGKHPISDDDINLAANSCSAIAFRDSVFKVVPGVITQAAYKAAMRCAVGDQKTLVERRAAAIVTFGKMGVSEARVLAMLDVRKVELITVEHLETLVGVLSALKDGMTTIAEVFGEEPKIKPVESKLVAKVEPVAAPDVVTGEIIETPAQAIQTAPPAETPDNPTTAANVQPEAAEREISVAEVQMVLREYTTKVQSDIPSHTREATWEAVEALAGRKLAGPRDLTQEERANVLGLFGGAV
jgi:hypothetical protein